MVTTHKKIAVQHSLLGVILGYFWAHFDVFPIFLENHSIFFHNILYRCSWYSTLIFSSCHVSLGLILVYVPLYFLRTVRYFLMKLCTDVYGITLTAKSLKYFNHIIYVSAGRHFWVFLNLLFWWMFLYFLRTVKYFLVKFCTDIFSITRAVPKLKKNFTLFLSLLGAILGVFWGPFAIFLGPF